MSAQEVSLDAAREWVLSSYKAYDSLNIKEVEKIYKPDAALSYAGADDIKGREGILAFFNQGFSTLTNLKHELNHIDIVQNRIYQHCSISYTFVGAEASPPLTIRALAVAWFGEDGAWEVRKGGMEGMVRFEAFLDTGLFPKGALEA